MHTPSSSSSSELVWTPDTACRDLCADLPKATFQNQSGKKISPRELLAQLALSYYRLGSSEPSLGVTLRRLAPAHCIAVSELELFAQDAFPQPWK